MSQREDALKFETGRIKALQEERLHIQKKTFTKWMNSFLAKARMEVEDVFVDLADGKKLLKLLEIISGEKLGKPNSGKMRVHKIENVNKSLAFLHTKVRLESIGAEDIVDGNPRLILGLIWTIILRFQIQEIEIDVDEENESSEKKSAKDALLLWCQRKTAGYPGVHIQDFTGSWRSGLGFNALIHSHRPDLINFEALNPHEHIDNLNNAFDVAHRDLGIARLLDAEDIDTNKPDEKSVMTYVASYYHTFAKMKNEMKGGRRIANIVGQMMDADQQKMNYERFSTNLLNWIHEKIQQLEDRNFPNSLDGIQREFLKFKMYRTEEKPPKYKERSEIEAMLFSIQMKLKALGQPLYMPPEGRLVHDIERAWEALEKAEYAREVALRDALLRHERLEQLAYKFERKSVLREGYLKDMLHVLSDPRYGSNLMQVEATLKKHEAISADILARKERFHDLVNMADELVKEDYHGKDVIVKRKDTIMENWKNLLDLLNKHKQMFMTYNTVMGIMRDSEMVLSQIQVLGESISSDDYGKHLLAVEDLLQKHSLLESQIAIQGESIKRLTRQSQQFIDAGHKDAPALEKQIQRLNTEYDSLLQLSSDRREKLDDSRIFLQFVQDHEEEEAWVIEKQRICQTVIAGKDMRAVLSLQRKHKALEDEMKARWPKTEQIFKTGESLIKQQHPEMPVLKARMENLQTCWNQLHKLASVRRKQLADVEEMCQYHADANETDSWMNEKITLVSSTDYGEDEPSAQSLLQRHGHLESEIKAYEGDIQRLNEQAERLIELGISSPTMVEQLPIAPLDEKDQYVNEIVYVPEEIEVEQVFEKEVVKEVMEDKKVPQVKAAYSFNGQGMEMQKGEVMLLLNRTNNDWWNVRKANGCEGFIPANYVKEVEPKLVRRLIKRTVKVPETKLVKKTVKKPQIIRKKREKSPHSQLKRSTSLGENSENESVKTRQTHITQTYQSLLKQAKARRLLLEDAMKLFSFYRECDDFEAWMKDKEKMLATEDKTESVENLRRKFEKFLTDMSASSRRVEDIDNKVAEFVQNGHSQLSAIQFRQKQIHNRWNKLNQLRALKEKNLEGASSVELFNRTCDEARDWMLEKMDKMDTDDLGKDLKTVQALQRKHKNLERELAPVEEKFKRVNLLAQSVKSSYPTERKNVDERQKELQGFWDNVKSKAVDRRSRLEDAVGCQIFNNTAKNLLSWTNDVQQKLSNSEAARDVATAENISKQHQELKDDILAHQDEFNDLYKLGSALLRSNPNAKDIEDKMNQLKEQQKVIQKEWEQKANLLKQNVDLQIFNREADNIDAITSNHETFLEVIDLGNSPDDVQALMKRHEDFENMFIAQEDRLKQFSDLANKLIGLKHYDSKYINDRRNQVLARRNEVKKKAANRKHLLLASRDYHEFKADSEELSSWIQEKCRNASDESYKDLTNLERKLKKHEAFEGELKANEGRLRDINRVGQNLIGENHLNSPQVAQVLDDVNQEWRKLCNQTENKGKKLHQAAALHIYYRMLEDAKVKLDEVETSLQSEDLGNDLRSVKYLLKKHQGIENDLNVWSQKIEDLTHLGEDMAKDGHFDSMNILKQTKELNKRFSSLQSPVARRRQQLEESLKLFQFFFEVEVERQWIVEHMPIVCSTDIGQSLVDAQNLTKKHKKLERELVGHQPVIEKTLNKGAALVENKHYASDALKAKCSELEQEWKNLTVLANERKKNLELALKLQQFFSEANEIEMWLNEKNDLLSSQDYGRDEDAAVKFLTKHKALELEIDSYNGLINEMGHQAQQMIDSKHADSKLIQHKQQMIMQQLKNLFKLATIRRQKLMESKHRHEYFRESDELEKWINEQIQTATSDEFGHDYEHLLILQARFDDFKARVEASSEQFNQCEELAKKLISNESPYGPEIETRQEQLGNAWNLLLEQMNVRDQKLQAAGEIHRFNRDAAEAIQRIQEKYASIPDDLGRDLNSVLGLIRRHEGFENDLVALEAQLQVLIDDSARLQAAYPGGNAEHIQMQQDVVIEQWNVLQEHSMSRKKTLQASCDLQRFLASVRDLVSWANSLKANILMEEKVRDAASAQMLKTEHDRLKAEIEAREESFSAVVHTGEFLIQNEHYAKVEIQEKIDQLLDARQKLHAAWQHKKVYLDQLIDLQFFLRDAKQQDTISSAQEAYLSSTENFVTVEEVNSQLKKHDAFEKLLISHDEKLVTLKNHSSKLIQQNHFDAANIKRRIDEVTMRRSRIKELSSYRKQNLADALLYAQFTSEVVETEIWIEDKQKKLELEQQTGSGLSLEDKIKRLQKHQTFQAELIAHETSVNEIKKKGEMLLNKHHEASPNIRQQLEHLLTQWNQLLYDSNSRSRGLEEAQDILEFTNQVEKVEAWIRDKEMMVQAGDMGKDYEHCLALQRKLDDVDSDMKVDEARIKKINAVADRLICQGHSDTRSVQQRKEEVNQKWRALQGALHEYHERLSGASEIHAFNRDIDDTNDRINEKAVIMSAEDYGKDLSSVEALQRKQEAIKRDMTVIDGKLKEHDVEARKLIQKYADMTTPIRTKLSDVQENWRRLTSLCHTRKQLLASSFTLQKFLSELKELETWVNEMIARMIANKSPNGIPEAEALMQLQQERKAEIDGRQETFKGLKEFGHHLIQQHHYAKEEIEKSLVHLEELRRRLLQVWEEQKQILKQSLDYQLFCAQADQTDGWLSSKEAFLHNEDLGDSLASIDTLIRKHQGFEKTMEAQSDKIEELDKFATELVAGKHSDATKIQEQLHVVCRRRDQLKEMAVVRRHKLQESKAYQQFLRNNYEIVAWIIEKMQVACDENYRDPTNLQRKLQQHLAFDAEIAANKGRYNAVHREGESLIASGNFAGLEIQSQLDDLESKWRLLQDESQLKRERLNDAYQAMLFHRTLEDLDLWMDEVEMHLQSEDLGKDLASAQHLLKKHQNLEIDINHHNENVEQIKDVAANFINSGHFMSDEIQERSQLVVKRYISLHEPMQIRRENLEEAVLLQQFYRDVEDEMTWIAEKEVVAASTDLGTNLTAVQNLQKKHQTLEVEIQSHEAVITSVINMAQQIVRNNNFASSKIEQETQNLKTMWQHLKDQVSVRRLRLLDAVESQMFYSDVGEAETWIKDKLLILNNPDLGKDEESVQTLLKKLDALEWDIENYTTVIAKLHKLHQQLIERGHFDSANIKEKQVGVESSYRDLKCVAEKRKLTLNDSKKLYKYLREANELIEWIEEQMTIANSEEYGRDLEHVEVIIPKFESFLNNLHVNEERINEIRVVGLALVEDGHHSPEVIRQKVEEVLQMWEELNEHAHSRQEALKGAKMVHVFDRNADETVSWIQEKDASLSSEDYGQDLESIQRLVRKHEGFERDLAAVKDLVESVVTEAQRLASMFPDARDHISVRHEETIEAWNCLLDKSAQRKDKLQQAEQLQSYFEDYRELLSWINEMMAKITAPDLMQDVLGAKNLLIRHQEYHAEIDTRQDSMMQFHQMGQNLISQGHFMGEEIQEKISRLQSSYQLLLTTWAKRQKLYEQNYDIQLFKRDADNLEAWIQNREPVLHDDYLGDSIAAVEDLIRKHEDFEKTIEAQKENFAALERITLLEEAFRKQKEEEVANQKAEVERREQERLDTIKRKEQQRILDERRKEDGRRRTTEIKYKDNDLSLPVGNLTSTISTSTEKLTRYPSMESVNSASGVQMRKMTSVEIPDIKPSDDFIKSNGTDKLNLRRGESMRIEHPAKSNESSGSSIKRSESMKLDEHQKKLKKTPSFTTRRRTQSFRKNKRTPEGTPSLPPVEMEGFLERKQELQSGGKRAAMRSWKTFYTVLCGQLVCFFKDKEDFIVNKAIAPPLTIHQAKCSPASNYTKKKNVLRLQLTDGAEYLFVSDNNETMMAWINKINFHASLPPRMQLMSYDDACKDGTSANSPSSTQVDGPPPPAETMSGMPVSSLKYSPENKTYVSEQSARNAGVERPEPQQPIYVNFPFHPEATVQSKEVVKPPVPARSSSIPSHPPVYGSKQTSNNNNNNNNGINAAPFPTPEDGLVKNRIQMFQSSLKNRATYHGGDNNHEFQTFKGNNSRPHSTGNFDSASPEPVWVYRKSVVENMGLARDEEPPPLPVTLPPSVSPYIPAFHSHSRSDDGTWQDEHEYYNYVGLLKNNEDTSSNNFRNSQQNSPDPSSSNVVSRHHSLPPYSVPPDADYVQRHSATVDTRLRMTSNNDGFADNDFNSDKKAAKEKKRFRFFKKT